MCGRVRTQPQSLPEEVGAGARPARTPPRPPCPRCGPRSSRRGGGQTPPPPSFKTGAGPSPAGLLSQPSRAARTPPQSPSFQLLLASPTSLPSPPSPHLPSLTPPPAASLYFSLRPRDTRRQQTEGPFGSRESPWCPLRVPAPPSLPPGITLGQFVREDLGQPGGGWFYPLSVPGGGNQGVLGKQGMSRTFPLSKALTFKGLYFTTLKWQNEVTAPPAPPAHH